MGDADTACQQGLTEQRTLRLPDQPQDWPNMLTMRLRMADMPCRGTKQGFGFIELIVAVAILAVLVALAAPPFRELLDRYALRVAQTDYIAGLQHAHDLAVNEQVRVVFCPSSDGLTCSSDNAWKHGWLIGRDPQNKGQPDGAPLYTGATYSGRLAITGTGDKSVRFQPDGTAGNSNQTLTICVHDHDTRALNVVIARRGRIRGDVADAEDAARCAGTD
jgi:type IV fimbrial biogenesis protein FimT